MDRKQNAIIPPAQPTSHIVGYLNKADTRLAMNYVTPTFRAITGDLDVQAIQLDAIVGDNASNLQRLTAGGGMASVLYWYTITGAKGLGAIEAGDTSYDNLNGVWIEQYKYINDKGKERTGYRLPTGDLAKVAIGDGFQIQLPTDSNSFQFNGEVGEDDMLQKSRAAMNYIGNPYPANCPVQNFQLTGVGDNASNLQRLTAGGGMASALYWYTIAGAKGLGAIAAGDTTYDDLNGVWIEQYKYLNDKGKERTGYRLPEAAELAIVPAGSAVQVQMPAAELDMFVLAPYDL